MYIPLKQWPEVKRRVEAFAALHSPKELGLDLEWDENEKPSIIGVSDGRTNISVRYSEGKERFLKLLHENSGLTLIGHNIIGADLFVLAEEGIEIPLEQIEDTIIRYYLCNMHLCKMSQKGSLDDGDGERRGRGFMNLGTMSSIYTSLPYWKTCRGEVCDGNCPKHDPFLYNGTDSLAPVLALPKLRKQCLLRGVEHLYPLHKKLIFHLAKMSRRGVDIDVPYVNKLKAEFEEEKFSIEKQCISRGFNPDSPKQVLDHFKKKEIFLTDAQEQTIRDAYEDEDDSDLGLLLEYKELGNGTDRWFKPQYRDKDGYLKGFLTPAGKVHPRINIFTSSGRLMCSSPNFQNISKRRVDRHLCSCNHTDEQHDFKTEKKVCLLCDCKEFKPQNIGKKVRRAIIAPDGFYLGKADFSNAENRVFLYLAGYENPPDNIDFHTRMADDIGILDSDRFAENLGGRREAAKSVCHGTNYLEGLSLVEPAALKGKKIKSEINAGARIVFEDWSFLGKIVTFTGINLARRAFGEATYENRAAALAIVNKYFSNLPRIRDLQKKITKQVEKDKVVRPPHGYSTLSYGLPEDRLKQAAAIYGSQPIAHFTKLALLNSEEHELYKSGLWFDVLQVHDEIVWYVNDSVPIDEAASAVRKCMEIETKEMPGFICPVEVSYGEKKDGEPSNWRDQKKVARVATAK